MKLPIPHADHSLLLRTDFSDDEAWTVLCDLLQEPVDEFGARLRCLSDRAFEGLTPARLAELAADEEELSYAFLADAAAIHLAASKSHIHRDRYSDFVCCESNLYCRRVALLD
jgi:hypothetical protein